MEPEIRFQYLNSPPTGEGTRLPRYDAAQSYDWNYAHAPEPVNVPVPPVPGTWDFCGVPVDSPLGVAAGPLLNGRWVLYYASLGFDVLTYKTVRSVERACYAMPNLLPVRCGQLRGGETSVAADTRLGESWAVSFGMPSRAPDIWRADIDATRRQLPKGKLLSVSVVATEQPGWTLDDLAADYARCARWAIESGADAVETNFSCPNVSTCDGQLYQSPADAGRVAQEVREAVGRVPYVIKIGHISPEQDADALVAALAPWADALALTNSIAATVVDAQGRTLFDGQRRGICGAAIREASIALVARLREATARRAAKLWLIGVGGAFSSADVRAYLHAGAHAVHLATAPMMRPDVALDIRRDWA